MRQLSIDVRISNFSFLFFFNFNSNVNPDNVQEKQLLKIELFILLAFLAYFRLDTIQICIMLFIGIYDEFIYSNLLYFISINSYHVYNVDILNWIQSMSYQITLQLVIFLNLEGWIITMPCVAFEPDLWLVIFDHIAF